MGYTVLLCILLCSTVQYASCNHNINDELDGKERNILVDDVMWVGFLFVCVFGFSYICCFIDSTAALVPPPPPRATLPHVIHVRIDHNDARKKTKRMSPHMEDLEGEEEEEA